MNHTFPELQDLLGPMIKLRVYTGICYFFPLSDPSQVPRITRTLEDGYKRLLQHLPWLTGHITIQNARPGRCTTPIVNRTNDPPCILINNLSVPTPDGIIFPSYEELRAANFPFRLLDGNLLNPRETKAIFYDDKTPTPVFIVQLNIIRGGIILTISGEHSIMDGQGATQITRLLSKSCQNIPLTPEEIHESNRSRMNVIPLLDRTTYLSTPQLQRHIITKAQKEAAKATASGSADPSSNVTTMNDPDWSWHYIHFSSLSVRQIKAYANTSKPASTPYISTNDALSALLWQTLSRARLSRLPSTTPTTFSRAVDMRPHLSLSPLYQGNMIQTSFTPSTLSEIATSPLGYVSALLRAHLDPENLTTALRAIATYVSEHDDDLPDIHVGNGVDMSRDIWFSSWAKLPCHEFDFGLGLGRPEKVRVPRGGAFEGLLYLMPVDLEGGIDAAVCVRGSDLLGMKGDEEFGRWAEWVG